MNTTLLIALVVIPLLLCFSAFFSAAETAITAASRARIHARAEGGERRARRVMFLIEHRERLIGAILVGNNLVNIFASALATSLLLHLAGEAGVVYATLVMTVVIVVFAEILPKTWAIGRPDKFVLSGAHLLRATLAVFGPFARLAHWFTGGIVRTKPKTGPAHERAQSAREELRGTISLHHHEGIVVKDDRDMLGGLLDLDEVHVADVMMHRKNISMVDANLSAPELINAILECGHSRVPLWRDEKENIIGVIHVKALLRSVVHAEGQIASLDVAALAQEPWFVPQTRPLRAQLDAFLKRKNHVAFAVDEYGALMGLVTLEDILEEIVGDIADEHDRTGADIERQEDGSILADAAMPIRDLNRALDWKLPDEDVATLAGLVIHEAERIPEPGEEFDLHGIRFNVMDTRKNQITRLKMTPLPRDDVPERR